MRKTAEQRAKERTAALRKKALEARKLRSKAAELERQAGRLTSMIASLDQQRTANMLEAYHLRWEAQNL